MGPQTLAPLQAPLPQVSTLGPRAGARDCLSLPWVPALSSLPFPMPSFS